MVVKLNLLKFIELQRKETLFHRIPIPIKVVLVLSPQVAVFLLNMKPPASDVAYLLHVVILGIVIALGLRAPKYALDILIAFTLLYAFGGVLYVLRGESFVGFFVERKSWLILLLYLAYSLAFVLSTTNIEQFEAFLHRVKFPKRWIPAVVVSYNLIPAIYNETRQILMHQVARGLQFSKNPIVRLRQLIALYIPIIFVSLMREEHLELSLRARGY